MATGDLKKNPTLRPIYLSQSSTGSKRYNDSDSEDEDFIGSRKPRVSVPKLDANLEQLRQTTSYKEDQEKGRHEQISKRWKTTKEALSSPGNEKRAFIPVPNSIASWLRKHGKEVRPELTEEQHFELRECFNLIDSDGSGSIDSDEIEHAFKFMGIKLPGQDLAQLKAGLDKDGDGDVAYPEFVSFMMPKLESHSMLSDPNVDVDKQAEVPTLPFPLMATAYRRRKLLEALLSNDVAARKRLNEITHKSRIAASHDVEEDHKRMLIKQQELYRKLNNKPSPLKARTPRANMPSKSPIHNRPTPRAERLSSRHVTLSNREVMPKKGGGGGGGSGGARPDPLPTSRGKGPQVSTSLDRKFNHPYVNVSDVSTRRFERTFSDPMDEPISQSARVQSSRHSPTQIFRPVKNMGMLKPLARAYQSHDRNQREWWAMSGKARPSGEMYSPVKFTLRTEVMRESAPSMSYSYR